MPGLNSCQLVTSQLPINAPAPLLGGSHEEIINDIVYIFLVCRD